MLSFFKRREKPETTGLLPFSTDIHSHLLPGLDDGSPDVDTSLKLMQGLQSLGISRSITTPHVIGDMYRNEPGGINAALEIVNAAIAGSAVTVQLDAAAEYMLDDHFLQMLRSGEKLLTISGDHLLTEFPFASAPAHTEEIAFEIINAGYSPILAHPERYGWLQANPKAIFRLADLGFSFQLNALSLTDYYGKQTQKAALMLVKNDLVSFCGTDCHHERHLSALKQNAGLISAALGGKKYNSIFD